MTFRRLTLPATAIALALAALPAVAQTPMDDPLDARDGRRLDKMEKVVRELRAIVFQGRDTGKPVVVQPAETDFQLQELARRVEDLEQSLTRVNGQLEIVSRDLFESRRAGEQLQAQNKALTERLAVLEQQGAPPPPEGATADAPAPPQGSPTEAFTQARQLMLNGDYDGAERAWRGYVDAYGDSAKGPEARYWYGKTLGARGAHADAAAAYIGAIRGWPQTGWAPDAVVELSRELIALKKPADACTTLAEFARRYPKANPAVKSRAASARTQAKCG